MKDQDHVLLGNTATGDAERPPSTPRTFVVITPEYGEVVPVVDGQGPMEYGCDVAYVEAETRRDALVLGVRLMQKRGDHYFRHCENPYAGMRVLAAQRCQHGRGEWERCLRCEHEWRHDEAHHDG